MQYEAALRAFEDEQRQSMIALYDRDDQTYTAGSYMHDGPCVSIELIDWATIHDHGDAIVDGVLLPGRWTFLVAKAKEGKTWFEMFTTVEISLGRDPFDGTLRAPVTVLYVDGEMGRFDLEERIKGLGHDPASLTHWHATDLPPRLNTIEGGAALLATVQQLGATVVVIDGINGTVEGAEKDDTVWRAFYDHTIFPLKRAGVAILTGDNYGKDASLGPRGSSVKMDKADAVVKLSRTDNGVKLTTTHRRTSDYPPELLLTVDGINGDRPVTFRRANTSWPAGTTEAAALLDELAVPTTVGRNKAREALDAARATSADPDRYRIRNDVLGAAIRYRKTEIGVLALLDGTAS